MIGLLMAENKTIPELILLSDEPVANSGEDKLKMLAYAEIIAGAALHTPGPFTIGVFGKWGEGKTSLLKLAKSLLDNDFSKPITVWFNAWQYDHEEHPLVPLALAIANAVDVVAPEPDKRGKLAQWIVTRREMAAALRTLVAGLTLSALPLSFSGKDSLAEFDKLTSGDAASVFGPSIYQRAFAMLEQASADWQDEAGDTNRPPIVVFIDDLDRCLPGHALKLLQSIRLVLGQPGFVFAIALDREPIVQHLISVYEELKVHDPDVAGQAYLDKIVQLPLWVPSHHLAFPKYIKQLLETKAMKASPHVADVLRGLSDLLEIGTDAKPRALVRLINNLIVDDFLWGERSDAVDWLGLCAVSRLLREKLGSGQYLNLVRNKHVCEELTEKTDPKNDEWRTTGKLPRAERTPEADLRFVVWRLLERTPAIRALLDSPLGKRWLTEHDNRLEIDQFLDTERSEGTATVNERDTTIVDRAIRTSLELSDDAAITQELRESVTKLDLTFASITDKGLAQLKGLPLLSTLYLSGTLITDAGAAHLSVLTALRALSLSGTLITDAGLERLKDLALLDWLNLCKTEITDAGLTHLKGLTSLSVLYLSDTSITDAGLEHLAGLTSLSQLLVSDTLITDAGLEHLKGLTSLSMLDLSRTLITDAGLEHLKGVSSLSALLLSDTSIANAGLELLRGLTSLSWLDLRGTSITDAGLEQLKELTSLSWLNLSRTSITDVGLEHLKELTTLSELALSKTSITDAGKELLRERLPNLNIH
jgi:Leucine-rich repeat (LRR) protein